MITKSASCDHCGESIDRTHNSNFVYWCADCMYDEFHLLEQTPLSSFFQIKKLRLPYSWSILYNVELVKKIPKKKSKQEIVNEPLEAILGLPRMEPVSTPVCAKAYYGCGVCSCGSCPSKGYMPNYDAFGYKKARS